MSECTGKVICEGFLGRGGHRLVCTDCGWTVPVSGFGIGIRLTEESCNKLRATVASMSDPSTI